MCHLFYKIFSHVPMKNESLCFQAFWWLCDSWPYKVMKCLLAIFHHIAVNSANSSPWSTGLHVSTWSPLSMSGVRHPTGTDGMFTDLQSPSFGGAFILPLCLSKSVLLQSAPPWHPFWCPQSSGMSLFPSRGVWRIEGLIIEDSVWHRVSTEWALVPWASFIVCNAERWWAHGTWGGGWSKRQCGMETWGPWLSITSYRVP